MSKVRSLKSSIQKWFLSKNSHATECSKTCNQATRREASCFCGANLDFRTSIPDGNGGLFFMMISPPKIHWFRWFLRETAGDGARPPKAPCLRQSCGLLSQCNAAQKGGEAGVPLALKLGRTIFKLASDIHSALFAYGPVSSQLRGASAGYCPRTRSFTATSSGVRVSIC